MANWDLIKPFDKYKCNICGNRRFFLYGQFNGYNGIKCDYCGFVTVENMPDDKLLQNLYSGNYFISYYQGIGYEEAYEKYLKHDFKAKIKLIINKFKDKSINILEIGCGLAYFSKLLKENGYKNVQSWDISEDARQVSNKIGVDVQLIDIFQYDEQLDSFDLVISWATIEHTKNPKTFYQNMLKFVKPGGTLMFDTGLIDTFKDRNSYGLSGWFYPPEHLCVFTQKSLKTLTYGCRKFKLTINNKYTIVKRIISFLVFIKKIILRRNYNLCHDVGLVIVKKKII